MTSERLCPISDELASVLADAMETDLCDVSEAPTYDFVEFNPDLALCIEDSRRWSVPLRGIDLYAPSDNETSGVIDMRDNVWLRDGDVEWLRGLQRGLDIGRFDKWLSDNTRVAIEPTTGRVRRRVDLRNIPWLSTPDTVLDLVSLSAIFGERVFDEGREQLDVWYSKDGRPHSNINDTDSKLDDFLGEFGGDSMSEREGGG